MRQYGAVILRIFCSVKRLHTTTSVTETSVYQMQQLYLDESWYEEAALVAVVQFLPVVLDKLPGSFPALFTASCDATDYWHGVLGTNLFLVERKARRRSFTPDSQRAIWANWGAAARLRFSFEMHHCCCGYACLTSHRSLSWWGKPVVTQLIEHWLPVSFYISS